MAVWINKENFNRRGGGDNLGQQFKLIFNKLY